VALATVIGFTCSTILVYRWSQRLFPVPYRGAAALALYFGAIATYGIGALAESALAPAGRQAESLVVRILLLGAFTVVAFRSSRRVPMPGEVR
jgi:hypothetical protein